MTIGFRASGAVLMMLAMAACAHAPPQQTAARDVCSITANAAHDALVRVPFEVVRGRVYVQARVNGGGPYRFAVDTGASGMGRADSSLVNLLHLPVTGTDQSSDGVTTASANTVHFDSVELGGLRRENLDVITRDYSSTMPPEAAIQGILGREFFADGLLVIDFPSHTLFFTRTASLSPQDAGALAYVRAFRVPASIGDLSVTANLDTGAGVALVLPKATYDQVAASPLEAAGRARLTNNVIETSRAIVHGPVRVGGALANDVETRVSERYPEVLIGAEILQHYRIAFDQRTSVAAVCPP